MRETQAHDSLSHSLVRVFRMVNRAHNKALKPLGLSSIQAHILTVLWAESPLTVGELQRRLSMGSSTLTGAIDRMVKQELVVREPSPNDRRSFQVRPPRWSKKRRDQVLNCLAKTEADCYQSLSPSESETLAATLRQLCDDSAEVV